MKALITRIAAWLKSLFQRKGKRLFVLALKAAGSAASERYNDPELQQAALACIKAAAAKALHGDDAWDAAWAGFKEYAIAVGKDWGRSTLETILQTTYSNFKESLAKAANATTTEAVQ